MMCSVKLHIARELFIFFHPTRLLAPLYTQWARSIQRGTTAYINIDYFNRSPCKKKTPP